MMALAFTLTLPGLAALALAMDRHAALLPPTIDGLRWRWVLRSLGCVGLMASLACTLTDVGGLLAVITWISMLTPGTLAVAGAASIAARRHHHRKNTKNNGIPTMR